MTGDAITIRRLGPDDVAVLEEASHLFDHPVQRELATRFLSADGHHVLIAYEDGVPAGFVTGIEMTHPDKGTEMFLYELGVDARFRRRGHGTALVQGLAALAQERDCYGMWVLMDDDNAAALATYSAAGATRDAPSVMLSWSFRERLVP
jgi:ribosomal protein S18 acetylase RimI-like enzyme